MVENRLRTPAPWKDFNNMKCNDPFIEYKVYQI